MLKVKVEPVEPSLYGKVSLPNNPLTIAGYQVFCNDDEPHEDKVEEEEDGGQEDHLSSGGDGEIEGADRMMTDCCRENDLLGGDLGSDHGVKDEDGIHIRGFVENDVMVDNNIVEEQVVEDSMVLVSPVMHESSSDSIQVPYMETGPTEVLVIEEGAELMVENNHGIGYSHMIMDENREYLITTEDGEPPETLITEDDGHHIADNNDMNFNQPEHVVVERISYEMSMIQSGANQYYLQEDQPMETRVQHGIDIEQDHLIPQPIIKPLEIIPQKLRVKNKKAIRKDSKVPEPTQKKKKAPKRKLVDKNSECTVNLPESLTNKPKKRRKNELGEATISHKVSTPKQDKKSIVERQSTQVSPIQANHPTISLLLSKKGPTELIGPVTKPVKKDTMLKKQLFPSYVEGGIDLTTNKRTTKAILSQVKAKTPTVPPKAKTTILPPKTKAITAPPKAKAIAAPPKAKIITAPPKAKAIAAPPKAKTTVAPPKAKSVIAPPQPPSIKFQAILPQVVTEINEAEEMPMQVTHPESDKRPTTKKTMLKIPKSPIKHSKNNKHASKSLLKVVPSASEVTQLSKQTVLKFGNQPAVVQMTAESEAKTVQKDSLIKIKSAITQPAMSLTAPITVAVADNLAIASLPPAPSASVLTVPKPVRRLQVCQAPTSKSMPSNTTVALGSTETLPLTSVLSITVSPTSPKDVSSHSVLSPDIDSLVSPIQKKYQAVTTTLQARLAAKPNSALNVPETLADRYMKEWKPTGRFQCKLCLYSCVTHNFLFRHWVLNHCSLRPYMCGHCGFQSATRDGVTRHQTAKHRGLSRKIYVDNDRQEELWNKFDNMFQGSGFVTEVERQSQATYTLEHVSKAQHLQDAGQFRSKLTDETERTFDKEVEVVGSTILNVPKRDKVEGKFREMILSSSDDQDLSSGKESSEEDVIAQAEDPVIQWYYIESHTKTKSNPEGNLPGNPSIDVVPVTLSVSGSEAALNTCPSTFKDEGKGLQESPYSSHLEHDGSNIVGQLYEQCITSGSTSVHTAMQAAAQDSVDSTELFVAASEDKNMAAQVDSTTAITQVSSENEALQESTHGGEKD